MSGAVAGAAAITVSSMNDISLQFLWSPNRMTIYRPGTCWAFSTELGLLRHPLSGPEENLLGPQPPITQTTIVGVPRSNYTSSASKPPSLSLSLSGVCVCSNPLGAVWASIRVSQSSSELSGIAWLEITAHRGLISARG